MKQLTLEYVLENKFSINDCVRYFKPDISDEEADFIIWEQTCFPFSNEIMIQQLNKLFLNEDKKCGGGTTEQ